MQEGAEVVPNQGEISELSVIGCIIWFHEIQKYNKRNRYFNTFSVAES